MVDLSIIIVNYNNKGLLKQCVRSIFENIKNSPLKYVITIVDNNSSDGSLKMIREEFSKCRLIPLQKNLGYAKALNIGIKSLESRYYLALNMDTTIVQDKALEKLVNFMDAHQQVGIASPKLINPNGKTQASVCTFPKFTYPIYRRTFLGKLPIGKKAIRKYLMLDWDHNNTRAVDWVIGTGLIIRNEAIKDVGLMDERFFMYFEDVDWCQRMWKKNWQVFYVHNIEIVHYHNRGSAKKSGLGSILFNKLTRIHIQSWIKYFLKYSLKKDEKENK